MILQIFDRAFRLLPKSIQVSLLIEDLKRVEGSRAYHQGFARVLEERSSEIRTRLRELGVERL